MTTRRTCICGQIVDGDLDKCTHLEMDGREPRDVGRNRLGRQLDDLCSDSLRVQLPILVIVGEDDDGNLELEKPELDRGRYDGEVVLFENGATELVRVVERRAEVMLCGERSLVQPSLALFCRRNTVSSAPEMW